MPGKTSKIKLDRAFAKHEPTSSRSRLLPGGWWLWCLLGLGLGLGVWVGGRHYLRSELALQLGSTQSRPGALASIDALMRLDGDAAVDVSRALAHPDFVVAHTAFRALNKQLDTWSNLDSAERSERMADLISQLEQVPRDCDQDHRILVTGLASRLYADALGSRESSAAELLDRCKRVMDRTAPVASTSSATAIESRLADDGLADDRLAPIEGSLSATDSRQLATDSSVPAPLPPIESSGVTAQLSDGSISHSSTMEYSDPAQPLAQSTMPRLSSTSDEPAESPTDAPRVHLTGAPSRRATLVDRRAQMTLSSSSSAPALADDHSSRTQFALRQDASSQDASSQDSPDQKLYAAQAFDESNTAILDAQSASNGRPVQAAPRSAASLLSTQDASTQDASTAEESRAEEETLAGIDKLSIDQLVRLLSSLQPRVAQAAALALRRKGMNDDQLDLAMQLAVGSSRERLELLQSLGRRSDLDPRPWLLWMAADGDEPVREQAVGMLAPLLDQEVRRQLRLLLNQERDERVAQTLRRVLVQ